MKYRRLTNGLQDKGRLIPETASVFDYIKDFNKDHYLSTFLYTEEQKMAFDISGTVAGVTEVTTDKLWFDFDLEEDPSIAQKEAITLIERLISNGIDPKDMVIAYSGKKGFGVEVSLTQELNPREVKNIAFDLASDLPTFDVKVYNATRVIRVITTKHNKTGLYKTPISYEQIKTLDLDQIIELSKQDPQFNEDEFRWKAVALPESLKISSKQEPAIKPVIDKKFNIADLDFNLKIRGWSNCKWAILNGYQVKQNDRHEKLLAIVSQSKSLHNTKQQAYYNAKMADEYGVENYGGTKSSKDDLWALVESVYSDNWKGGTYSCKDGKSPWLTEICQSLGAHKCKAEEEEIKPVTFADLRTEFKTYVKNIEKNTIKTGIKEIDDYVFLSTGANVGIIGAAGCHAKDTEILMHDGTVKKVQDVLIDDLLMGPDSQPRKVLTLKRGREEMVKIKPSRSEEFVVNRNHILHLSSSEESLNITVDDYIKDLHGDQLLVSGFKLVKTAVNFKERSLHIPPYILGLWLSDGLPSKIDSGTMGEDIDTKNFKDDLKLYNLIGNKHVPKDYLLASKKQRSELLVGFLDGHGYCKNTFMGREVSEKSAKLASDIVFLARSLGFDSRIDERQTIVVDFISPNKLTQEFTYETLPEDDYYGFTLDKDHLYLTSDFFIHHNSGKTSVGLEILNNTSKAGVRSVVASLDMAKNRIFEKIMYRLSGLSRESLYSLFKEDKEEALLQKLVEEFGNVNFFKKSSPTVQDIKEYVIKCNESGPKVKLVVIDYFERINSDFSDDTAASKRIAGELQDLVDELDVCLVTLVQPNKNAISSGPDSPIYDYTKIKGSSFVYQAFRIIMSCWRPFYSPKDFKNDHYMQMAVLKNDLGELNEFVLGWEGKRGLITTLDDFRREEFAQMMKAKEEKKSNTDIF